MVAFISNFFFCSNSQLNRYNPLMLAFSALLVGSLKTGLIFSYIQRTFCYYKIFRHLYIKLEYKLTVLRRF